MTNLPGLHLRPRDHFGIDSSISFSAPSPLDPGIPYPPAHSRRRRG